MKPTHYILHICIWIGLILLRVLSKNSNELEEAIIISITLYGIYALTFYGSVFIQRQTFEKKRFLSFSIYLVILFVLGTVVLRVSFKILDYILHAEIPFGVKQYGFIRILFVLLTSFVYRLIINKQQVENQKNAVLLEKKETELQFLKNQINPHFFFNTLNNIYGLSYNSNPKAPEAILKLSHAMRYIIYETQSDRVPLARELDFISNYLELERLRLLHPENLTYNRADSHISYKIAPLILLPFIENCFKHGDIVTNPNGKVEINIWIENEYLHFSCVNSFAKQQNHVYGGVGNDNVAKRLELIYKDEYKLEKQIEENQYFVFLELPLNK